MIKGGSSSNEPNYTLLAVFLITAASIIFVGGWGFCSANYSSTEVRTVTICDKFVSDNSYYIAVNDGKTYHVNYSVYGFIPKIGEATLEFTTNGFDGRISVTKIYNQPDCPKGCSS
jgi:hypothetical protein